MFFVSQNKGDLVFITLLPDENANLNDQISQAYTELSDYMLQNDIEILNERIYCKVSAANDIQVIRKHTVETNSNYFRLRPTFVEGTPCYSREFAGFHVIGVHNSKHHEIDYLERNDVICGRKFHGEEADYVALSDVAALLPKSAHSDKATEAYETIRMADEILHANNWSFRDVRRTWFYLDNILEWYNDFNKARTRYYHQSGLMNGSIKTIIPASTGIMGRSAYGFSTTMDLLAMRPSNEHFFEVKRMVNPKQNEATDYGSAFSRGVSITTELNTYAFVSGTASIDEQGNSVHPDDIQKQTTRTLENIEALLSGVDGNLHDIQQATAFVKQKEDIALFEQEIERRGLEELPIICTVADVCRPDLLFELDATAVIEK